MLFVGWACAATAACSSSKPPTGAGAASPDAAAQDDASASSDAGAADASAETGDGGPGVRWVGRVDFTNSAGPRFSWSGSGFVANVSGTTISVKLRTSGSSDPVFFQPVVDGTVGTRFSVASGEQTVTLASNLAGGNHAVEVYRETEGKYGFTTFEGFTDGVLQAPPAAPGRLIEFVGDSITAGFGDLGAEQHPNYGPDPDGGCPFSTMTESAYAAYGPVAARTVHADWSLVAVSGWGLIRDVANDTSNILPLVYADTLGLSASPTWSFQPEPQAVVVNLGTNDFSTGDPGQAQFEAGYTAFLGTLRGKYPDAWIFCAVGPLLFGSGLSSAETYVQDVVTAANTAGDAKVQYLEFTEENTSLGTGCQYHPTVTEQQSVATALVAALHGALGW
jgi:hypothetical protein